jgi:hypothetical protein
MTTLDGARENRFAQWWFDIYIDRLAGKKKNRVKEEPEIAI